MKKLLLTLILIMLGLGAFASDKDEALAFFNYFVKASNNYSQEIPDMYSDNAKIIRQIIKPNGSTANAYFSINDYRHQMILSAKLAKLRKYKNYYSDISVTKVANGYRINSMRKPSLSDYKLKASMVVQKQSDGEWLIVEEMMQTKEQIFLKYVK